MANCEQCGNPLRTLANDDEPGCPHCALSLLWADEEEEPGFDQPDDYEIEEELGRGGDGTVYLCRDRKVGRKVAIKFVDSLRSADPAPRQRFRAEIETIASLDHPHIIPVYANGELGGRPFYTMKYVSGGSLAKVARSPLPPITAVAIMRKISSAVQHAHERGVLHRDLKPSNILLDQKGEPYLSDFGLAKRNNNNDFPLTITGSVMGTPAYMSPEQARGENASLSPASDVFSLGSLFAFLLTGEHLFDAESPHLILRQVIEDEPRFPSDLDRDLVAIAQKCLEKNPINRYANVQALGDDLARWENKEPITARHQTLTRKVTRFAKRRSLPLLVSALALALLVVIWPARKSPPEPQSERVPESDLEYTARLDQSLALLRSHDFQTANQVLDSAHPDQRGFAWTLAKSLAAGDETAPPSDSTDDKKWFTKNAPPNQEWIVEQTTDKILLFRRSDLSNRSPFFTFEKYTPGPSTTKFSIDSRYLIVKTGEHFEVRDLYSGKLTISESMPGATGFTPCHDSPAFTLFGQFPYLMSWNYVAETLARPNTLALPNAHFQGTALGDDAFIHLGHFRGTSDLVSLPQGGGFVTRHHDGSVRHFPPLRDLPGRDDDFSTGVRDAPPAVSHSGRYCFFKNSYGQPELRDLKKKEALLFDIFLSQLAVFNDGRILTLIDETGQITCWQYGPAGKLTWLWNADTELPGSQNQRVIQSAVSSDENFASVLFPTGFLSIDLQSQKARFTPTPSIGSSIAITADGSHTAIAATSTTVYHRPSQTNVVLQKVEGDHTHLCFSSDQKTLFIGTGNGMLEIYDLDRLKKGPIQNTRLSDGPVSALATADSGRALFTGGDSALTLRKSDDPAFAWLKIPLRSSPGFIQETSSHGLYLLDQNGVIERLKLHSF